MTMPTYKSERLFQFCNGLVLVLFCVTMIAPFIHLTAVSLSSVKYADAKVVYFWPKGFNLDVYKEIFGLERLWRSFGISVYICVVGTFLFLLLCSMMAYALSRPRMPGRKLVLKGILVTFVFTSPLIPNYMLIKTLGMENTLWALMVPNAVGAFSIIIMKTFFQGISAELFDAARIDGSSEYNTYARIAIPLSAPVLATLALFHVVGLWNSYFNALIYLRDKDLFPLQVVLRSLIIASDASLEATGDVPTTATPEMMKAGLILVSTVPILFVYPFLQKYFVKGAMLGSLKE